MQTFLQKEYMLMQLAKVVPFDAGKAIVEQDAIVRLSTSKAPIKLTVNQFRALQMGFWYPHPDDRGNALVGDDDLVLPGDDQPTAEDLAALRATIIANNQGANDRKELSAQYPELWKLTGG